MNAGFRETASVMEESLKNKALESDPSENRRAFTRSSVVWTGRIQAGEQESDCVILNISANGAKLQLPEGAVFPDDVVLYVDRFDGLEASIRWRKGRRMGVKFLREPDDVRKMLGSALSAILKVS